MGTNIPKSIKIKLYYYKKEKNIMIYDFCNTYTIQKYCAVEANSLSEAIEKLKLSGNKFERRNDKETLINSKYRYVNDWKKLDFVVPDTESKNNK